MKELAIVKINKKFGNDENELLSKVVFEIEECYDSEMEAFNLINDNEELYTENDEKIILNPVYNKKSKNIEELGKAVYWGVIDTFFEFKKWEIDEKIKKQNEHNIKILKDSIKKIKGEGTKAEIELIIEKLQNAEYTLENLQEEKGNEAPLDKKDFENFLTETDKDGNENYFFVFSIYEY